MKKASIILIALFFGIIVNGFSQTTTPVPIKDFFVGKWEITVTGTPNGDAKFATNLVRKDGKLTGELSDPTNADKPKIPITSIEDSEGKIVINFSTSGYDVNIDLDKVDDNNLKGQLMGMFDAKAVRIKDK